jgi:short-subunit dehydrogenase
MEAFESIVSTNLTAAFLLSREVLPHMKTRGSGQIINIGSKISHNTNVRPNKVMYATTKSALEAFSFALNKELKQWGIRVSCLMPGTVHTFVSKDVQSQLSPYQVAEVVLMTIKLSDVDFEGIIFKSVNQDI